MALLFLFTALLVLLTFIFLLIGLISPSTGLFWYKGKPTRLKALGIYGLPLIAFFVYLLITQHECAENATLEEHANASAEYNAELVKQLRQLPTNAEFDYHAGKYTEKEGRQYMIVGMHSNKLCAWPIMEITGVARLGGLIDSKGMAYGGAGLDGLQYGIDSSNGAYRFYVKSVEDIID